MNLYDPAQSCVQAETLIDTFVQIRETIQGRRDSVSRGDIKDRAQAEILSSCKNMLDALELHMRHHASEVHKFVNGAEMTLADFCVASLYFDMKSGEEKELGEIFQPYKTLQGYFASLALETGYKVLPKIVKGDGSEESKSDGSSSSGALSTRGGFK